MLSDTGAVPICFPVALAHCDLARPRFFAVLLAPGPGELGQVEIIVRMHTQSHERGQSAHRVHTMQQGSRGGYTAIVLRLMCVEQSGFQGLYMHHGYL